MHIGLTASSVDNYKFHRVQSIELYTSWVADIYTLALQNNQASIREHFNKKMYSATNKNEVKDHQKRAKSASWKSRSIKHLEDPIEAA